MLVDIRLMMLAYVVLKREACCPRNWTIVDMEHPIT